MYIIISCSLTLDMSTITVETLSCFNVVPEKDSLCGCNRKLVVVTMLNVTELRVSSHDEPHASDSSQQLDQPCWTIRRVSRMVLHAHSSLAM